MGVLTVELLQKQGNQNEVTIPAAVHMLPSLIYATEGKGKKKKGLSKISKLYRIHVSGARMSGP